MSRFLGLIVFSDFRFLSFGLGLGIRVFDKCLFYSFWFLGVLVEDSQLVLAGLAYVSVIWSFSLFRVQYSWLAFRGSFRCFRLRQCQLLFLVAIFLFFGKDCFGGSCMCEEVEVGKFQLCGFCWMYLDLVWLKFFVFQV